MDRLKPGTIKPVELDHIRIDGGTQMRVHLNDEAVARYRALYEAGESLPPPIVFFDGSDYWPADGFHRYHAKRGSGATVMLCDVRPGDRRAAVLFAVAANAEHGVQRTHADTRRAVETLLKDEEWGKWSDREIARQVGGGVSPTTVGKYRKELAVADEPSVHCGQTRTATRGGKTIKINTAAIGKSKPKPDADEPRPAVVGIPADFKHTGPVHDPADFGPPPSQEAVAADVANRNQLIRDNYPAYAAAHHKWAVAVRDLAYELVLRDDTGGRLLAVIGLDLGDVGRALGEFDCDTVEAGRKIVGEYAGQLVDAFACSRIGPVPLFARLLDDRVGEMLTLFDRDADVTSLSPLFVTLAEGWGAPVPPEPQPDDFKPKIPAAWLKAFAKRLGALSSGYDEAPLRDLDMDAVRILRADVVDANASATQYYADWLRTQKKADAVADREWVAEMLACSTASAARTLFHEHETAVNELQKSIGQTPTCGKIEPLYSVGFSVVKPKEWLSTIKAAKKLDAGAGEKLAALVEQGVSIHTGDHWRKLLDEELGDFMSRDAGGEKPAAALAIPEKPDNQTSTWYQWAGRTAQACRTLGLDVEQILPTEFAVGLYREGLKPKKAAKRYAAAQEKQRDQDDVAETEADRVGWRDWTIAEMLLSQDARPFDATRIAAVFASYSVGTLGELIDSMTHEEQGVKAKGLKKKYPALTYGDAEQVVASGRDFMKSKRYREPRPATGADEDPGQQALEDMPLPTPADFGVTSSELQKLDSVAAITNCTKRHAGVRTVERGTVRHVVLGTEQHRGHECYRLAPLISPTDDDLEYSDANAAAEAGRFDGIGVIDHDLPGRSAAKKRRRIAAHPNMLIYVRADEQGAAHV